MSTLSTKNSFSHRLSIWLGRSNAHKIKSIKLKLVSVTYLALLALLRPFTHSFITQSETWRRLSFDLTGKNQLLLSGGNGLRFVVSTSDVTIGRSVFIHRRPFDVEKLESVLSLLPLGHKRRLIVDIGANIGTICIAAVGRGMFKRAIAIEPEPLNFSLLSANVHLNGLADKISRHNIALGNSDSQTLTFELCEDNHGDHRVHTSGNISLFNEGSRQTQIIRSEKFDSVVTSLSPMEDLIWMDTQGYEGHVLSGAATALQQRVPICTEFWPYGMVRSGCFEVFKSTLVEAGYKFFFDIDNGVGPIPLTAKSLDELRGKLGESGAYTDIFVY